MKTLIFSVVGVLASSFIEAQEPAKISYEIVSMTAGGFETNDFDRLGGSLEVRVGYSKTFGGEISSNYESLSLEEVRILTAYFKKRSVKELIGQTYESAAHHFWLDDLLHRIAFQNENAAPHLDRAILLKTAANYLSLWECPAFKGFSKNDVYRQILDVMNPSEEELKNEFKSEIIDFSKPEHQSKYLKLTTKKREVLLKDFNEMVSRVSRAAGNPLELVNEPIENFDDRARGFALYLKLTNGKTKMRIVFGPYSSAFRCYALQPE